MTVLLTFLLSACSDEKIESKTCTKYNEGEYEELKVNIEITDVMTVDIVADLNIADSELLKNVGLDFTNVDRSFKNAIKSLEDDGSVCE